MAANPNGRGYWLVASDGGIFGYGDAPFYGSAGNIRLNQPIVDMAATPSGDGYWLVASDGGIFGYGNAPFMGSGAGCVYGTTVDITARAGAYWIAGSSAQTAAFATDGVSCPSEPKANKEQRIARELFDRLNAERAARGLNTLGWDDQLAGRATDWSVQMSGPAGFNHSDLHPLLGRFYIAAENIGTGPLGVTSGSMHVAWMKSTTHRVNVLAPNLDVIGIGVYCAPDGTMWATQNFGRFPGSTLPWDFGPTPAQDPIVRNDVSGTTCR
jgi:uncharacterized protein YkwD